MDARIVKDRPILFSGAMVRAILEGTKTQTRRIVKGWPLGWLEPPTSFTPEFVVNSANGASPYGQAGDRLWVRETWAPHWMYEGIRPSDILIDDKSCLFYFADGGIKGGCEAGQRAKKWRPAIHMPRAASRITLEITEVRIQRLQDISEADAVAEGVNLQPRLTAYNKDSGCSWGKQDPVEAYCNLWDSINGAGAWGANPWVWALTFKRI